MWDWCVLLKETCKSVIRLSRCFMYAINKKWNKLQCVRTNTCILKSEHSLKNKRGFKPPFMIFLYVHNAKDKPSEEKDQLTDAKRLFQHIETWSMFRPTPITAVESCIAPSAAYRLTLVFPLIFLKTEDWSIVMGFYDRRRRTSLSIGML